MLMVLMAIVELGKVRLVAFRGWLWLVLTGGFLSGTFGCFPVMMYGPGPDYDIQPIYGADVAWDGGNIADVAGESTEPAVDGVSDSDNGAVQ